MLIQKQARNRRGIVKEAQAAVSCGTDANEIPELSMLIHRLAAMVTDQVRAAVSDQVQAMLSQERGNLARARLDSLEHSQKCAVNYSGERIVRSKEFRFRSGLGKTMFHEIQKEGSQYFDETFPKKVVPRTGGRAIGYRESDVDVWINKRPKCQE